MVYYTHDIFFTISNVAKLKNSLSFVGACWQFHADIYEPCPI